MKTALEGDDKEHIETKTAALGEASGNLAQKLYAEQAAAGAEAGSAEAAGDSAEAGADEAVDAEFEEVKEEDK